MFALLEKKYSVAILESAIRTFLYFMMVAQLLGIKSNYLKKGIDHDRTRTCNPQIRSLVPYPLGHMVLH